MSEVTRPEPSVGKQLPKKNFTVTDALLNDYFEGLDLGRSNFDAGKAPVPTMIATDADNYFGESAFSQQRGHLWMRQEWTFTKPMQAGAHYQTEAHIEDIYKKRNRTPDINDYSLYRHSSIRRISIESQPKALFF